MRSAIQSVLLASCLCVSGLARAHHSFTEYDNNRTIEVGGRLLEVSWRNPHVHLKVQSRETDGRMQVWDIETNSLSVLRRTNATPDALKVGDPVKVAGHPSKFAPARMWGTNVLTAHDQELVLELYGKPRWQSSAAGLKTTWFDGGTSGGANLGLFRVWSTQVDDPSSSLWRRDYPLTAAARKKLAAWNPHTDTVARGCNPKGMPTIMEEPYPIQFVDKGDVILLRLEEYDTVRSIEMKGRRVATLPKTRLGHSVGHWEGKTLVVETSRIDWPYLDPSGVPLGPNAALVERFTPSEDGSRLSYALDITDADTFTQPIELKRGWVWRPGEAVRPYNCVWP